MSTGIDRRKSDPEQVASSAPMELGCSCRREDTGMSAVIHIGTGNIESKVDVVDEPEGLRERRRPPPCLHLANH